ncbi:uncharacterized protein PAC_12542 [Phialocephala subalpina]|uniref:Uncharacterized protein n=1 Tax=Phialocephala subalpina TaxID=576137 RepID=A0A1L7XCA8_9HELO|nr:uncharacterized protein PAC_12542 [Phialocephala subalpina]
MSTNQARTNLGPLTTVASLPASCSYAIEQCSTCGQAWGAQMCFASTISSSITYGVQDNTDCWPTTASTVTAPPIPVQGWGFYSPGLECPNGMVSACSATGGVASGWPVQFGMLKEETAVGCCPSGYTCANGYAQTCLTTATSTSFSVLNCVSGTTGAFTVLTVPSAYTNTASSSSALATQLSFVLSAPLIEIRWQSSDRASSTSSSSSSTSTSVSGTGTGTGASATSSSSSLPLASSTPSSGLSTGAKAGIGIGAALGALALLGALAFFIYRKRKNAYAKAGQNSPGYLNPESATPVYELKDGNQGNYAASELPSGTQVAELPPGSRPPPPGYGTDKGNGPGQVHEMP